MSLTNLRLIIQHISFVILSYGVYFRISLGSYIPCLSCPFLYGCSGVCYLVTFQESLGIILLPFTDLYFSRNSLFVALWNLGSFFVSLALFSMLVILFGKTWCGWICPFGLVQDWVAKIRRRLRIRESEILLNNKYRLSSIKYIIFAYMTVCPILASLNLLPANFRFAFCNICPAKSIMPLFELNFQYMALDFTTNITLAFSIALLTITGVLFVGMFFKDRFFCLFCPMMVLVNMYRSLFILRIVKDPKACSGCGNCRRLCSMDNDTKYKERLRSDVHDSNCMGCFKCAEGCVSDRSLSVKIGPWIVFGSSRRYAAKR